tara:strand:+ start:818 stop:1339 length:522 start_codon:yes stop_codon:yes gene_type:complete
MSSKPTLQDAIDLATKYHEGQYDKGGKAYIGHPIRVMKKMVYEDEKIVAVLHDIVEDTDITLQDLRDMGYNSMIVNAIDCLSKRDGESYDDFIERTLTDTLACIVKLGDIEDNMDLDRLKTVKVKDKIRYNKYKKVHAKIKTHLKDEENKVCKHCLEPPMYCACYEEMIKEKS